MVATKVSSKYSCVTTAVQTFETEGTYSTYKCGLLTLHYGLYISLSVCCTLPVRQELQMRLMSDIPAVIIKHCLYNASAESLFVHRIWFLLYFTLP